VRAINAALVDVVLADFRRLDGAGDFFPSVLSVLPKWNNTGRCDHVPETTMTVLLITAMQAAEMLATFQQEQADKKPPCRPRLDRIEQIIDPKREAHA